MFGVGELGDVGGGVTECDEFFAVRQSDADQLEAAADQAIAASGGDAREAVKALIVANHYLEADLEKLKAAASMGYARGRIAEEAKTLPRDRKDWYD